MSDYELLNRIHEALEEMGRPGTTDEKLDELADVIIIAAQNIKQLCRVSCKS